MEKDRKAEVVARHGNAIRAHQANGREKKKAQSRAESEGWFHREALCLARAENANSMKKARNLSKGSVLSEKRGRQACSVGGGGKSAHRTAEKHGKINGAWPVF